SPTTRPAGWWSGLRARRWWRDRLRAGARAARPCRAAPGFPCEAGCWRRSASRSRPAAPAGRSTRGSPGRVAPELVLFVFVVVIAADARGLFRSAVEHAIGNAVFDSLFGEEPLVAVEVALDLIDVLAGEFAQQLVQPVAQAKHVRG